LSSAAMPPSPAAGVALGPPSVSSGTKEALGDGYNYDSTAIQLPFDCNSTAL